MYILVGADIKIYKISLHDQRHFKTSLMHNFEHNITDYNKICCIILLKAKKKIRVAALNLQEMLQI